MEMPKGKAAYTAFLKYEYYNSIGDTKRRIEWIEKTLIHEPEFAYGHLQAGWALQSQYTQSTEPEIKKNMKRSLVRAADLGMSEDPQWLNAWGGHLSRIEGAHSEAEEVLRRAVEGGVYTQYVHLLMASGLIDEAIELLRTATTRYPFFLADRDYLTVGLGLKGDFHAMLESCLLYTSPSPRDS